MIKIWNFHLSIDENHVQMFFTFQFGPLPKLKKLRSLSNGHILLPTAFDGSRLPRLLDVSCDMNYWKMHLTFYWDIHISCISFCPFNLRF